MKIRRTVAPDMRQAIKKVREEQGPDAVILGNRRVEEGIEIISAVDMDAESLYRARDNESLEVQGDPGTPLAEQRSRAAMQAYASPPPVESHWEDDDSVTDDHVAEFSQQLSRFQGQGGVEPAPSAPAQAVIPRPAPQEFVPEDEEPSFDSVPGLNAKVQSDAPYTEEDFRRRAKKKANASQKAAMSKPPVMAPISPATNRVETPAEPVRAQPPAQTLPPEATTAVSAPVNNDIMHDMQRELQNLRGLMQNQWSVMQFGAQTSKNPVRVNLLARMHEFGIGSDVGKALVENISERDDMDRAWRQCLGVLANRIPIAEEDFMANGGVIAIVGPTGVGKTTSIAKIAARFAMRHGNRNVALVSMDNYRVGAHEQLLNYARILNVPMKVASNAEELNRALTSLYDKKLVLIDTAGMSQRDMRLSEQFSNLREGSPLIKVYLTIAATAQLKTLEETVRAFSKVDLTGAIITKLDEATALGAVLTVMIRNQLPITFLGVGQRVPEDLQLARAHRLVSRGFTEAPPDISKEDPEVLAAKYAGVVSDAIA